MHVSNILGALGASTAGLLLVCAFFTGPVSTLNAHPFIGLPHITHNDSRCSIHFSNLFDSGFLSAHSRASLAEAWVRRARGRGVRGVAEAWLRRTRRGRGVGEACEAWQRRARRGRGVAEACEA